MRLTRKAVLAGIASLAVAGAALAAEAPRFHTLNVQAPDGAVVHVRYSGDVAPTISFDRVSAPGWLDPAGFMAGFDPAPFAMLDRMMASMDREAEAMLRRARSGAIPGGQGPGLLAASGLPGNAAYTLVSETVDNGTCARSVEVTRTDPAAKPSVVTQQSGDCGPGAAASTPNAPAQSPPGGNAPAKPEKPAGQPSGDRLTI